MFAIFRTCCHCAVILLALLFSTFASGQTVILRVDGPSGSATPAGLGNDWGSNAFKYLSDAIELASVLFNLPEPPDDVQIWVAAGTYRPDQGDGLTPGTQSLSFDLHPNVSIFGGFAGDEPPGPTGFAMRDPDPTSNGCVLSGLLSAGHSANIVKATGSLIDDTAQLDGFTISDGSDDDQDGGGGGIRITSGAAPIIRRCRFINNLGANGGAAYVASGGNAPLFRECEFTGNPAFDLGGGMFIDACGPTLVQCRFVENVAGTLNVFTGIVDGSNGGGVQVRNGGYPKIFNCEFQHNRCGHVGGGLSMRDNNTSLQTLVVNCVFVANSCNDSGGGVRVGYGSNALFVNCTFVENYCTAVSTAMVLGGSGGGLSIGSDTESETGRSVVIDNCIFWSNQVHNTIAHGSQIALVGRCGGTATINHSDIMDSDPAEDGVDVLPDELVLCNDEEQAFVLNPMLGRLDVDPEFVIDPSPGGDGDWGTSDDILGDVRLLATSPVINRGAAMICLTTSAMWTTMVTRGKSCRWICFLKRARRCGSIWASRSIRTPARPTPIMMEPSMSPTCWR